MNEHTNKTLIHRYDITVEYIKWHPILKYETTVRDPSGNEGYREHSYLTSRGAQQGGKRIAVRMGKRLRKQNKKDSKRKDTIRFPHEVYL